MLPLGVIQTSLILPSLKRNVSLALQILTYVEYAAFFGHRGPKNSSCYTTFFCAGRAEKDIFANFAKVAQRDYLYKKAFFIPKR